MGSHVWERIVQGISIWLIYLGQVVTEHCRPQTAGSTYAHERGTLALQTLCSHHQGSELQSSGSWGTVAAPSVKSKVMLPSRDETERYQERVAVMYTDWEDEDDDDKEFNLHRRCDATSHDQAGCPPSDMIVMWVSPNKGAMADLRQVKAWFKEFETQLVEDVDFP